MDNIIFREDIVPSIDQLMDLYNDVEWSSYTEDRIKLKNSVDNSLKVITAWDNEKLVGLIRIVGDGYTIIYIQDILILKDYQGRGIGSYLLKLTLERYKDIHQIVLMTDETEETINFYQKNGMKKIGDFNCVAFMK